MIHADRRGTEWRVLILAPTGKDAMLTQTILNKAEVETLICRDADQLCREASLGAGLILIVEEAITGAARRGLAELLGNQPAWSDLPILVLTRQGADSTTVTAALDDLGNVSLLERPVRVAALVSLVRVALRARERQYQIRKQIGQQEHAELALREADRRKDDFLATLAHELRNPLAPIRNSIHILRMTAKAEPTAEHVHDMLERQVSHMVRLVDDLMEVSRITRGKIELRKEPVDLAASIRSAIETSEPLIEAGGHELTVEIPDEALTLDADPVRLVQILSNLLNNAARHADKPGKIHLAVRRDGDAVVVSIRDTGVGITADMLPRIFEMFTQFDGSHRRSQGGLGIGLTLVRSLVQMHGGSVAAYSEGLGKGSEFVVRLPLLEGNPSVAPQRQLPAPAVAPLRVLVADDNADAADSLGTLLEYLGAKVLVVHDGAAALAALETFDPGLVLLDIGMPGMDGYEVARHIRQQPEFQELVLIALTGWGQEEDRRRSQAAGFDHHLIKPTDIDRLQALMTTVRQDRAQQRKVAAVKSHATSPS